ncbi:peptidoglycan/LPS O-acetylase OafA/YrhL [Micromonospora pisi]|uniref:Peptidoglycan/LPS O-acetylase OafA/YrhL n=1 Tax=Micromonospora pisi TaxID=589240 RepID=A0A495JLK8_9ACTN|nr:acyltransferase [Micromonospora pisi]RKR89438.1 peptidoglycan/LPS O-acetylase OafA/YrhL [Micromonospora pisi]
MGATTGDTTRDTNEGAVTTSSSSRLDSITGLRWFAAFAVFGYHLAANASFYEQRDALRFVFLAGSSAVSFFFILSGFVLTWQPQRTESKRVFWWRRFARIYPSHLVTFIAAAFMLRWLGDPLGTKVALTHLTLTQTWIPERSDYWWGFNGVSWSLSCEMFFYLCFPFLAPLIRRASNRALWAIMVTFIALVMAMPWLSDLGEPVGLGETYIVYILPLSRILEFVLGMALATLVRRGHWHGPGLIVSSLFTIFCLTVVVRLAPSSWPNIRVTTATVIAYTLLVAAAAVADVRRTRSLFRARWIVYLGEVSFAFYLVHLMVILSANELLRGHHKLPLAASFLAVFAVSLMFAMAVHEFVEKPFVKILHPSRISTYGEAFRARYRGPRGRGARRSIEDPPLPVVASVPAERDPAGLPG